MHRVSLCSIACLAAAETTAPVLERLDAPRRAAVVMALLALVLTGLALIACAMLGGHWVRRLARHDPASRRADSTATSVENRQWRDSLQDILPASKSADTVQLDITTTETKADPP